MASQAKKLPKFELRCIRCGNAWLTQARARSTIRCPNCSHPTKVPAKRPGNPVQPLPEQSPVTAPGRRRKRDSAPYSHEYVQRQVDSQERVELRATGLTESQARKEQKRRKAERDGPNIVDIAAQAMSLLGADSPYGRASGPVQPRPSRSVQPRRQSTSAGKSISTLCPYDLCSSPVSFVVAQTMGSKRALYVCSAHVLLASQGLGRLGVPVSAVPLADLRPTPPTCAARDCDIPSASVVVQTLGPGGGTTGMQHIVCTAHVADALANLGSGRVETY